MHQGSAVLLGEGLHALAHLGAGGFGAFPAQHLDPLAFFEVFVVLKKVGNGVQTCDYGLGRSSRGGIPPNQ